MADDLDTAEKQIAPSHGSDQQIEDLKHIETTRTYYNPTDVYELSQEHRAYLLERHGTLELDPIPGFGDADPYNWASRKKITNLLLVAFHTMMATFTAASIQSAFNDIAADLNYSLQTTTYLTSLFIAILGVAPLIWQPLSLRYGRRPIFLLSLVFSAIGNVGCAESPSYVSMAVCRAITAFFISPPAAIGTAVVKETFFKKERARYMGIWALMVTLGVSAAPFIFGFVAYRVNYRWIYWILAMINAAQFVLYLFLGPETRYIRKGVHHNPSNLKQEYLTFRRIDYTPFRLSSFVHPLSYFTKPCVILPTIAYSMVFGFASVLVTVEIPQLFAEKFDFNAQQLGLQFLGTIIGSFTGEIISSFTSDKWMIRHAQKIGERSGPEHRLWLSYAGYLLAIIGMIVFLVQIENATPFHWNVSPIIGAGIAAVGNQIVTTVLITYAVDCYSEDAAGVGVFITFVRQIWGFIGPFWFPQMFDNCGLYASAVICTVLIMVASFAPTVFIQWKGKSLRR